MIRDRILKYLVRGSNNGEDRFMSWLLNRYVFYWPSPGSYEPGLAYENPIVTAAARYLANQIAKAPFKSYDKMDGMETDHPILKILADPNRDIIQSWPQFLLDLIIIYFAEGVCIIRIQTDEQGMPIGFEAVSQARIKTRNKRVLIDGVVVEDESTLIPLVYRYGSGHSIQRYGPQQWFYYAGNSPMDDVIPESPLLPASLYLYLDKATVESAYGRMKSPVLGLVYDQTAAGGNLTLSKKQQDALDKQLDEARGLGAGKPGVFTGLGKPMELQGPHQSFQFNNVHALAEERISAIFGLPPSVLQLGTGLEQTKVGATLKEEIRLAWEDGVLPMMKMLEFFFNKAIMPVFDMEPTDELAFDKSNIEILNEIELSSRTEQWREDLKLGIITPEQFYQLRGYKEHFGDFVVQPMPGEAEAAMKWATAD